MKNAATSGTKRNDEQTDEVLGYGGFSCGGFLACGWGWENYQPATPAQNSYKSARPAHMPLRAVY